MLFRSNDLSIMSDLELLLQQHMESLSVPRQTARGSSEDTDEARKHSALRKLDTLVLTLKNRLNSSVNVKENPGTVVLEVAFPAMGFD